MTPLHLYVLVQATDTDKCSFIDTVISLIIETNVVELKTKAHTNNYNISLHNSAKSRIQKKPFNSNTMVNKHS